MKRWNTILPMGLAAGLISAPAAAQSNTEPSAPPATEARSVMDNPPIWGASPQEPTPAPSVREEAARAMREGRWRDAQRLWAEVLRRFPDSIDATAELGWALLNTGAESDARREFGRALRLEPTNLRASAGMVELAIRNRKPDEAVRLAQETARARPESGLAFRVLGDAQKAAARRSEAEGAYRRAVALDPNDPISHAGLADVLLIRNKADEAIREYRAAVRLDPSSGGSFEGLGRAAMAGGRYGEAARAYAEAMDLALRPQPDWARLDALSLVLLDALGRSAIGVYNGTETREDAFEANTKTLAVADALAEMPAIASSDPAASPAMAQRAMAYDLIGQAAANDLAALRGDGAAQSADAVVFREQARRAIIAARAAGLSAEEAR